MKRMTAVAVVLLATFAGRAARAESGFLDQWIPAGMKEDVLKVAGVRPGGGGNPPQHQNPAPRPTPPAPPAPRPTPPAPRPTPPAPKPPTPAPKPPTPAPKPPTPTPQPPTPAPKPPTPTPQPPTPAPKPPTPAPKPPTPAPKPPTPAPKPPTSPAPRPPVVVPPHQGGGNPGDHRMPAPPKHDEHQRIDPARGGDGRVVHPPAERDGRPVTQRPWRDGHGRDLPPGHDHITIINNRTVVNNITVVQRGWRHDDHDYHWHDWNGWRVCHHYDTWGYHWWGFYVGDVYFWTRYWNNGYWWYDPYWHRWVYMSNGQWWWQGPDGVYVYTGGWYYRYGPATGGVIMTPDPTPPVEVPPGDSTTTPPPADQASTYSTDGTRSIQVLGDSKDAYLYDLTVTDSNDPAAAGRWLASGVQDVKFLNDGNGGVNQIVLTVTDETGAQSVRIFDRDGNAAATAAVVPTAAEKTQALQTRLQGSAAFSLLKSGSVRW